MHIDDAISILETRKTKLLEISDRNAFQPEFKRWSRETLIAIQHIFGKGTQHTSEFQDIEFAFENDDGYYWDLESDFRFGTEHMISLIDSFITEIKEYGLPITESKSSHTQDTFEKIRLIINRFETVARQLKRRHSNRHTLKINDEYDVQDLFHTLLRLFFEDIRDEEYTPSYAGAGSRIDFILKAENTAIEIKKTRRGLTAKRIGEELMIDSQRYQNHPHCKHLICFVYDPDGFINNPRGIENDLSQTLNDVPISVFISPN